MVSGGGVFLVAVVVAKKGVQTMSAIPKSVLDILSDQWPPDNFDIYVEAIKTRPYILREPNYYHFTKELDAFTNLSLSDVRKLVRDGVVRNLNRSKGASINENEVHAVEAFCHKAYAAWAECCDRIDQAQREEGK